MTKEKKKHEDTEQIYKMYYDRTERISSVQPHRIMAIERAESEKVIAVTLDYDQGWLMNYAVRGITRNRLTIAQEQIEEAVKNALENTKQFWNNYTEIIQIKTPERSLDILMNHLLMS